MPISTFNEHPVIFSFSVANGLSITPGPGDPSTHIHNDSLICILPTDHADTYTLIHQISSTELIRTPIIFPPQALLDHYLLPVLPVHLSPAAVDTTIIISTASGGGSAVSFYNAILAPLCSMLHLSPSIVRTTSVTSIAETIAALSAHSGKPQTVLLLSGDTGVYDVINAMHTGPTPIFLAVFPLGTGNALASSYHTSRGVSPLRALLFGAPKPLPTFTATFSAGAKRVGPEGVEVKASGVTGAVVASWGFHASLVADAEALRGDNVGVERFKVAAGQNLQTPLHQYRGTVSYLSPHDGEWKRIERDQHFYVLATLCSNLEANFRISPSSVPGDQLLRLVHFGPVESAGDVMSIMQGAYEGGTHLQDARVGYEEAKAVRIEVEESEERWRRVCVDGGIVVLPESGWIEIMMSGEEGVKLIWSE